MKNQLEAILKNAEADLEKAQNINDIEEIKLKYLSRKGELNSIKKNLKDLSNDEKCPFVLWVGKKRLIKRKRFDDYIENQYSI